MSISSTWKSTVEAVAGLCATLAGTDLLARSSDTWPTIVVAIGVYVLATGIRGLGG